eukprot:5471096-Amphidinium_carterae.1
MTRALSLAFSTSPPLDSTYLSRSCRSQEISAKAGSWAKEAIVALLTTSGGLPPPEFPCAEADIPTCAEGPASRHGCRDGPTKRSTLDYGAHGLATMATVVRLKVVLHS